MKTDSHFSVVKQNILATHADLQNRQYMSRKKQMCWRCQKDKPLKGGAIKFFGSLRRFLCCDCVAERAAK